MSITRMHLSRPYQYPEAIIPNYIAWIIPSPLGLGPGIHPSGVGIHCPDCGIREIDVVGIVSFGISAFGMDRDVEPIFVQCV